MILVKARSKSGGLRWRSTYSLVTSSFGAVSVHLREREGLFPLPAWQQAFKKNSAVSSLYYFFLKTFTVNINQAGIVPFSLSFLLKQQRNGTFVVNS